MMESSQINGRNAEEMVKAHYTIGVLCDTHAVYYEELDGVVLEFIKAQKVAIIVAEATGEYLVIVSDEKEILKDRLLTIYDTLSACKNVGAYIVGKNMGIGKISVSKLFLQDISETVIFSMDIMNQLSIVEWLEEMGEINCYIQDYPISNCLYLLSLATPLYIGTTRFVKSNIENIYQYRDGHILSIIELLNSWAGLIDDAEIKLCYNKFTARTLEYLYRMDGLRYISDTEWESVRDWLLDGVDDLVVKWEWNEKRFTKVAIRRKYVDLIKQPRLSRMLEEWFYINAGYELELENPKTFNQKLNWMKLYDNRSIKTVLSDKYRVREWIREKIGEKYLIPLLGVWNKAEDIDFDKLPNSFMLKVNQGSGFNIAVKDKSVLNIPQAIEKLNKWCQFDYYALGLELQYKDIEPKIICEAYVENDGKGLRDYKIHVFNGEPKYVRYICDRSDKKKTVERWYTPEWEPTEITYSFPMMQELIEPPACLEEMLEIARILGKDFAFVRVDLYVLNDGSIKFGEMTFTPANGMDPIGPEGMDRAMGEMINLEKCKID